MMDSFQKGSPPPENGGAGTECESVRPKVKTVGAQVLPFHRRSGNTCRGCGTHLASGDVCPACLAWDDRIRLGTAVMTGAAARR